MEKFDLACSNFSLAYLIKTEERTTGEKATRARESAREGDEEKKGERVPEAIFFDSSPRVSRR